LRHPFREHIFFGLNTVKRQVLAVAGTTIAGATAEGCQAAVQLYRELEGKQEATILMYGGRVPAHDAAFVNGVMARALDFCDSMAPGPHPGSAVIPAALAAAELAGGAAAHFISAVAVGTEVARASTCRSRHTAGSIPQASVNFRCGRVVENLGLSRKETWNALAMAFNSCGGSFQSHIDGSLGVRFVQGRVAQSGVVSARLALRGVTGPRNFLDGVYGYFHLYGKDLSNGETGVSELGSRWDLLKLVFKKYPSCALTAGSTDLILKLSAEQNLSSDDVERIDITVPPYTHKLVGHPFEIGDNPKVNAQFSIRYCVANALLRRASNRPLRGGGYPDPHRGAPEENYVVSDRSLRRAGTPIDMRVVIRE
jgi:2-methylcitrate dehydratase PrpD